MSLSEAVDCDGHAEPQQREAVGAACMALPGLREVQPMDIGHDSYIAPTGAIELRGERSPWHGERVTTPYAARLQLLALCLGLALISGWYLSPGPANYVGGLARGEFMPTRWPSYFACVVCPSWLRI